MKSLKAELKKAHQPLDALQSIEEKVEVFEEEIQKPVRRHTSNVQRSTLHAESSRSRGPLKVGDKVVLKTLGNEGTIVSLDELKRKNEAVIDEKLVTDKKGSGGSEKTSTRSPLLVSSPGLELDLRGQRAEDALDMLARYLERAFMTGLPFVRIIHGKAPANCARRCGPPSSTTRT